MVYSDHGVFGVASPSDLFYAGPDNKKVPRMNFRSNDHGHFGSRGPALRGQSASNTAVADSAETLVCGFPGCGRPFSTKSGRGLHQRRAHPDWMDAQQNIATVKARWNDEETLLLARREVELTQQSVKFINQALLDVFPDRLLESIKGKRKQLTYKALVQEMLSSVPDVLEEDQCVDVDETADYRAEIADFLRALPTTAVDAFDQARLTKICNSLSTSDPELVARDLMLYLRVVFPIRARNSKSTPKENVDNVASKRQRRRAEYARTQDLWRKNRSKCIRMLLDDIEDVQIPRKEVMVPFWEAVMSGGEESSPGIERCRPILKDLLAPITCAEIRKSLPANTTSSGPDGLTARSLKRIPLDILCKIFNIILWCGKAPTYLLESITLLIPKKSKARTPGDFRPITVSSVLIRTLPKILATRMVRAIELDQRQRAFRPTDGCSDNVFLLDMILRYHHKCHKPLFIASLDIAKAFDSVAHKTIQETLQIMGVPIPLVEYVGDVYSKSTTRLCCESWTSEKIKPTCGVKQGDPMSPIIFNTIIERLLKELPSDVGARIGGLTVNAAAFADDMLLFASTPIGLQKLLDSSIAFLSKCGLQVNASKCLTVSLRNVPREKKTVVDETVFLCQGRVLPALRRSSEWTYLGVPFTPEGRAKLSVTASLQEALTKLTKAPLKPQQRLFALRTNVIPGLYHQLELGCTNISMLRKCDRMVRYAVRCWLALPTDTPNAYFHASVKDGGLGVQSLRWQVPLRRFNRLNKLPLAQHEAEGIPGSFLEKEMRQCHSRLCDGDTQLSTSTDINKRWAEQLYAKIDGSGLRESSLVPQQHRWIQEGTRFLSGRDFVQSCRLRINALPTKSRTSRGRPKERLCRAGCNRSETLNHILQQCHRTHGPRIKRHDALASFIAASLERQEYRVVVEPKFQIDEGFRKPDIVEWLGVTALVIDAQVVNDQVDLNVVHSKKADYYKNLSSLIKRTYGVQEVKYTSATLSWRGVWSEESAKSLTSLGVLKKKSLKVLSSRVVIGGLAAFHQFNKLTTVGR